MTTTADRPTIAAAIPTEAAWSRLLAWTSGAVAAVDLVFLALIRTVVPPLAIAAVLTVVGLLLLRRSRRAGAIVLGVLALVMLVGSVPFAMAHIGHPSSALDFVHSVAGTVGRIPIVLAAIGVLRGSAPSGARRLGAVTVAVAGLTVAGAALAMLTSSGDAAGSGDVEVAVASTRFPDAMRAQAGDTLYVDNRDLFRHTFTIEAAGIDLDLPAAQGARLELGDLAPGWYEVICAVPGHEAMTGTLEVLQ
jgi:plastocyanin